MCNWDLWKYVGKCVSTRYGVGGRVRTWLSTSKLYGKQFKDDDPEEEVAEIDSYFDGPWRMIWIAPHSAKEDNASHTMYISTQKPITNVNKDDNVDEYEKKTASKFAWPRRTI